MAGKKYGATGNMTMTPKEKGEHAKCPVDSAGKHDWSAAKPVKSSGGKHGKNKTAKY